MKILILVLLMLGSLQVVAETEKLFIGFGEIPFLADSFKPSIGYSKRYGDLEYGFYLQLEDDLQRDDESFNADFGQDRLASSRETTLGIGMTFPISGGWSFTTDLTSDLPARHANPQSREIRRITMRQYSLRF